MKDSEDSKRDDNCESSSTVKVDCTINTKNSAASTTQIPQQTSLPLPFPVQFAMNELDRPLYAPMYFSPFLIHPQMVVPPNFNYNGNQGIFIRQAADNNQVFFIPGNIIADQIKGEQTVNKRIPEEVENLEVGNEKNCNTNRDNIFFVPNLGSSGQAITKEPSYDVDKFETYLVPVKIKKEINGNIQLLPEQQNEDQPQPTNPEQISILRKINTLKNQQVNKCISESTEMNVSENQIIIDNISDKTQGFVMFRFNKTDIPPKENIADNNLGIENKVQKNSLMISAAETGKAVNEGVIKKKNKISKRQKAHKLKLSAVSDKLEPPVQSTSRFRRLRVDDRTQCWNMSGVTCIDTRMRFLPAQIISLSETNSINIPDTVFNFLKQEEILTKSAYESIPSCKHVIAKDSGDKEKMFGNKKDLHKSSFWRYMCSMNNCEFIPPEKEMV